MIEKDLISVIIPVYKVEDYIGKCIKSVIDQTYEKLEIILVDDGSPDRSGEICDEYAAKDSRIKVIHKENDGVAMARNDGINIARGEFISFIDSDDWMDKRAYEVMLRKLKEYDADCVIGGCQTVYDKEGELTYEKPPRTEERSISSTEMMEFTIVVGSAAWNRLYKRKIFDTIRFPKGRINDDEVTALHIYSVCKKIISIKHITYFYRIRANSITTSTFSERKLDVYYNSLDNLEFVKTDRPELVESAEYKVYRTLIYCYLNLRKLKQSPDYDILRHRFKKDVRSNFKKAMSNPKMDLKHRAAYLLCILL